MENVIEYLFTCIICGEDVYTDEDEHGKPSSAQNGTQQCFDCSMKDTVVMCQVHINGIPIYECLVDIKDDNYIRHKVVEIPVVQNGDVVELVPCAYPEFLREDINNYIKNCNNKFIITK